MVLCHSTAACVFGNVRSSSPASKGPSRKHGDKSRGCVGAGETRTKRGFGNSGPTEETSLSLPPRRHETTLGQPRPTQRDAAAPSATADVFTAPLPTLQTGVNPCQPIPMGAAVLCTESCTSCCFASQFRWLSAKMHSRTLRAGSSTAQSIAAKLKSITGCPRTPGHAESRDCAPALSVFVHENPRPEAQAQARLTARTAWNGSAPPSTGI